MLGVVLCLYVVIAFLWSCGYVSKFTQGEIELWGVVFACAFWPLDLGRGLYRGGRNWWQL
jgi:Na+/melibiose symporter-like transporter